MLSVCPVIAARGCLSIACRLAPRVPLRRRRESLLVQLENRNGSRTQPKGWHRSRIGRSVAQVPLVIDDASPHIHRTSLRAQSGAQGTRHSINRPSVGTSTP
eukprot:scaffold577_cov405-Prasinococcus_capsulatus_cf.AAC.12